MKQKQILAILAALTFTAALISSCAGDPRKNCNHPQHGQYMSQKLAKKHGLPR